MIILFGLDIRSADDGEQTLEVRMRTHPPSESQICFGAIYQHIEVYVWRVMTMTNKRIGCCDYDVIGEADDEENQVVDVTKAVDLNEKVFIRICYQLIPSDDTWVDIKNISFI